jgi:hypothetical protein
MNKGKGIGIFVSVIAVAIVIGIASLPDEVLLDSPSVDNSETETMNLPISVIEEPVEIEPEVIEEVEPVEIEPEVIEEVEPVEIEPEVIEEMKKER